MAPRQGGKTGRTTAEATANHSSIFKIAGSIIDADKTVRLKSLIKKHNLKVKDACTLRDPSLGLTFLQIAIIADNIPAGALLSFPSLTK